MKGWGSYPTGSITCGPGSYYMDDESITVIRRDIVTLEDALCFVNEESDKEPDNPVVMFQLTDPWGDGVPSSGDYAGSGMFLVFHRKKFEEQNLDASSGVPLKTGFAKGVSEFQSGLKFGSRMYFRDAEAQGSNDGSGEAVNKEPGNEMNESESDRDRIFRIFTAYDADQSGTISRDELVALFKRLKGNLTDEEVDQLMEAFDTNGDGLIDLEEFIQGLCGTDEETEVQQAATRASKYSDRSTLLKTLRTKSVRLLKPQFIMDHFNSCDEPLPCRNFLPDHAFLDVDALGFDQQLLMEIVSVSYCWLNKDNPDPDQFHLRVLVALLEYFTQNGFHTCNPSYNLNGDDVPAWRMKDRGYHFGAGGKPVGVFLDWASLFQDKPEGIRTPEQLKLFKIALKNINIWYGHMMTLVWMLSYLPSSIPRSPYHESGWTVFECEIACIISESSMTLDISMDVREKVINKEYIDFLELTLNTMYKGRTLPKDPDDFDDVVDTLHFTNGSDKDAVVKPKYRKMFEELITLAPSLKFIGLSFTDSEVYKFMTFARKYCKMLRTVNMSANDISMPLSDFVDFAVEFQLQEITLSDNKRLEGCIADVGRVESLVTLALLNCHKLTGDIAPLSSLVNLEWICLDQCWEVQGDLGAFADCVMLWFLDLSGTRIKGDVAQLSNLIRLQTIGIGAGCGASGDIAAFRGMKKLKSLNCYGCNGMCGDIACLAELPSLTLFNLGDSKCTGDVMALTCLSNLQEGYPGNFVTGDMQEVMSILRSPR